MVQKASETATNLIDQVNASITLGTSVMLYTVATMVSMKPEDWIIRRLRMPTIYA